jgi:hypothetical protein
MAKTPLEKAGALTVNCYGLRYAGVNLQPLFCWKLLILH